MRLAFCSAATLAAALLAPAAFAQPEPPPYRPLPIPAPPGAKLQMEIDAHDRDLLGSLKSFFHGFNPQALMSIVSAAAPNAPIPRLGAPGTPMPGGGGPMPGGPGPTPGAPGPFGGFGGFGGGMPPGAMPPGGPGAPGAGMADVLRDIHHLHIVAYEGSGQNADELQRFYEEPFVKEGGHRILWVDLGGARMLMVGFEDPRGFAAVMLTGKEVVVARADGYPDLESVGPMLMSLVALGMQSTTPATPDAQTAPSQPAESIQIVPVKPPAKPKPAPKRRPARRPVRR